MREIINPDLYHGKNKKSNYFEGCYFKIVSKDRKNAFAFIPGIFMGKDDGHTHSFIQVLQGDKKQYNYCRYNCELFGASKKNFNVRIDKSEFSIDGIDLNINKSDIKVVGKLKFTEIKKWDGSLLNPGSMGFYNYLNFMECYSQVCALDGKVRGTLNIDGVIYDLNDGRVYIEKNWGRKFPIEWLWVQSNSFKEEVAITCSVAEIPFPIKSFKGFLIGVTVKDRFYRFTTMNRSKFKMSINSGDIKAEAINNNIKLSFETKSKKEDFMLCYGPKDGGMVPFVNETLIGKVHIKLEDIKLNEIIYEGEGECTGIEYGGRLLSAVRE